MATNRTILELKLGTAISNWSASSATNRTILELKPQDGYWELEAAAYQSHHTGIETAKWNSSGNRFLSTNRTILELKPRYCQACLTFKFTTNRTILELKHVFGWLLLIISSSYQSHHTGIETVENFDKRMIK